MLRERADRHTRHEKCADQRDAGNKWAHQAPC
jgi:hypothetical protein